MRTFAFFLLTLFLSTLAQGKTCSGVEVIKRECDPKAHNCSKAVSYTYLVNGAEYFSCPKAQTAAKFGLADARTRRQMLNKALNTGSPDLSTFLEGYCRDSSDVRSWFAKYRIKAITAIKPQITDPASKFAEAIKTTKYVVKHGWGCEGTEANTPTEIPTEGQPTAPSAPANRAASDA